MASIDTSKMPKPQSAVPTGRSNRMLTGYVFNIEFASKFSGQPDKVFFTQQIIYAKSLEIAEKYIARIWAHRHPSAYIVYEGFFFQ